MGALDVFLSTHRSPFIFQLPKRHVEPDRKTISKSLYQPETSGTQACLYSEPLSARMEVCALWRAQTAPSPCTVSTVMIIVLPRSSESCLAEHPGHSPAFLPAILDEWQGVLNGKGTVTSPWGPLWLVSTGVVLPTSPSSALNWHQVCHITTASCLVIM